MRSARRGRRPHGEDTRRALLEAARREFTACGYEHATVRAIAARAGVDAGVIAHWFGGKEHLFAEAILRPPFERANLVDDLLDGDVDSLGERIVRRFLTTWDAMDGGVFVALVRSFAGYEQSRQALEEIMLKRILSCLVKAIMSDRPELRASLCAGQLMGLGMVRYVARFEPLASADVERLVASAAPTMQRYLTGPID